VTAKKPGLDALYKQIGLRILQWKRRRGFTTKILARRSGLHLNTILNAESGDGCSIYSVYAIAAAMRVEAADILPHHRSLNDAKKSQLLVCSRKKTIATARTGVRLLFGTENTLDPASARPVVSPTTSSFKGNSTSV